MRHDNLRNAQDGSNRQPKFILPSTADRLQQGLDVKGLALVSALWCHYLAGKTDSGKAITFNDPNIERIQSYALKAKDALLAFLEMKDIFGEIGVNTLFQQRFSNALSSLQQHGTQTAGSGLGLSIVTMALEKLGGSLSFNKQSSGFTVRVTI